MTSLKGEGIKRSLTLLVRDYPMSVAKLAELLNDTFNPKERGNVFIYTQASVESFAKGLSDRFCVRVRGPHYLSFETMQLQEQDAQKEAELASDVYTQQLKDTRTAALRDSDDRDGHGNYRIYVMNHPQSDTDMNALAAISTSLITSAINDPKHTVAAFLPIGSSSDQALPPNTNADCEPIWGGVRSVIDHLGIVSFESLDELKAHLLH